MGIEIPICQNIKDKYRYNKNYTYISKPFLYLL